MKRSTASYWFYKKAAVVTSSTTSRPTLPVTAKRCLNPFLSNFSIFSRYCIRLASSTETSNLKTSFARTPPIHQFSCAITAFRSGKAKCIKEKGTIWRRELWDTSRLKYWTMSNSTKKAIFSASDVYFSIFLLGRNYSKRGTCTKWCQWLKTTGTWGRDWSLSGTWNQRWEIYCNDCLHLNPKRGLLLLRRWKMFILRRARCLSRIWDNRTTL